MPILLLLLRLAINITYRVLMPYPLTLEDLPTKSSSLSGSIYSRLIAIVVLALVIGFAFRPEILGPVLLVLALSY